MKIPIPLSHFLFKYRYISISLWILTSITRIISCYIWIQLLRLSCLDSMASPGAPWEGAAKMYHTSAKLTFFYLKLFKYYKILQQLLIDIHKIPNWNINMNIDALVGKNYLGVQKAPGGAKKLQGAPKAPGAREANKKNRKIVATFFLFFLGDSKKFVLCRGAKNFSRGRRMVNMVKVTPLLRLARMKRKER